MAERIVVLGALILSSTFIFVGLLLLLSPTKSLQFINWLTRADRWSRPNPEWKAGHDLERRLAGLVLASLGASCLIVMLAWALQPVGPQTIPTGPPPLRRVGRDWYSLAIGVTLLFGGTYVLIAPQPLVRWGIKNTPYRVIPDHTLRNWTIRVRVIAAVMIFSGIVAIRVWVRSIG